MRYQGQLESSRKIIYKIPEKHIRKERNQGTTENMHIESRTHTSESTNTKARKI